MKKPEGVYLEPPEYCDLCHRKINKIFIDGKLKKGKRYGSWANMCLKCHNEYGTGLGVGRGYKYKKREDEQFYRYN